MASIEQRASGSWSIYWRNAGRTGKQRVTVGPDAEQLAERILEFVDARRNKTTAAEVEDFFGLLGGDRGTEAADEMPTVDALADRWMATRTRVGGRQRADNRSKLDRIILPALRPKTVDQVRGSHISDILIGLQRDRKFVNRTVDRYYAVLLSLFAFAVAEKHLERSPVADCDWTPNLRAEDDIDEDGSDGHVYLTKKQFLQFRQGFTGEDRLFVDFLAATGTRWSEATALQVRDLTLDAKTPYVTIRRAWKQTEELAWYVGITKGRQKRQQLLFGEIAAEIAEHVKGKGREDLVFTAPKGGRLLAQNFARRRWNHAVARLRRCAEHPPPPPPKPRTGKTRELRADEVSTCDCDGLLRDLPTPHDLRHSFTAWQIAAGEPLVAVSKALGHSNTEVTEQVYAGILPEVKESMAEVMRKVFAPDPPSSVANG